jgi:outer membrane protein assembly factor BamB
MRNGGRLMAVATIVILVGVGSVVGQDWPQWRGPNRDGKLSGFTAPESWPKELTQKWKVTIGLGDSTPALVGDKLYAFGRQDANEVVCCIDAGSGNVLWRDAYTAEFVPTGPSSRHPGPRSSPAVADGKVCTLGVGGILSCLDAATGKVLWRKQSDADFLGTACQFESSMSPIIVDGACVVYIGGKGKGAMIAFDLATGQARWKYDGDAPVPSSPIVATIDGVRQIVTITESRVIGVSLADQTLLWDVPFKAKPVNSTTPVIDGRTVFVTGQGMGTIAVRVAKQGDKFAAEQAWINGDAQAHTQFTTPIWRDGLLFCCANSKLACLSAETGQLLWSDTTARGRSTAIVDAGSCLIALDLNGDLSVYRPDAKEYIELAHYKVAEPETWAHPVIAGRNIFIRDKDSLIRWTIGS